MSDTLYVLAAAYDDVDDALAVGGGAGAALGALAGKMG